MADSRCGPFYAYVYKKWFFEIKVIRGRSSMPFTIVHHFYSRLLTFELGPTDKFTLVIDNEETYDFLFKRPPVNLRANLYVMLVDTENRTVIKEEQICKYE